MKKTAKQELAQIEVKSRSELRRWLSANYSQKESIWLVTYKKAVPKWHLGYSSIVEEALCFGWIDSLPRALDRDRTMIRLSPRKLNSAWSKVNRDKVTMLIKKGLMRPSGLKVIKAAKLNGSWDLIKDVDSGQSPKDLKTALLLYPDAEKYFNAFPPSSKRAILEWIALAKTAETRAKRINETARLASKNIRANHYRQPKSQKPF